MLGPPSGGTAMPQPSSIRARVRALPDYPLQPSFKKIISTKNVNSINIDGQIKWKTCVLIRVTIFLTHLLN